MSFLEKMTIEELMTLNQDVQKVLKEKRKARQLNEEIFGKNVKITTVKNSEGKDVNYILRIRQRYVPDCYVAILDSSPEQFGHNFTELLKSMEEAYEYYLNKKNHSED